MVTDLGALSAILGMDFLKAYDAVINLKRDKVSLKVGTVINTLKEDGADRITVHLRQDYAMLKGHLNWCPVK